MKDGGSQNRAKQPSFTDDFRRFFLRGLAAVVPTLLTIAILAWSYRLLSENIGVPITEGMLATCSWATAQPAVGLVNPIRDPLMYGTPIDEWNTEGDRLTIEYKLLHHSALRHSDPTVRAKAEARRDRALWEIVFRKYKLHLVGFLIAIILVYFTGFFLARSLGRASLRIGESFVRKIPVIRAIYSNVKQVTDFLLSERKVEFSGVVAVQYPRMGCWSMGLRTGSPLQRIQDAAATELVTVFIPSSPTPVTGYVIQVPQSDVLELSMSIDEAFRFTISGGVISPDAILPDGSGWRDKVSG